MLMEPWEPQDRKVMQGLWGHRGLRGKKVEVGNLGPWVYLDQ